MSNLHYYILAEIVDMCDDNCILGFVDRLLPSNDDYMACILSYRNDVEGDYPVSVIVKSHNTHYIKKLIDGQTTKSISYEVARCIVKYGYVDLLELYFGDLVRNYSPLDTRQLLNCLVFTAVENGNLDVLIWLHNIGGRDVYMYRTAARCGHVNILKWMFANELPKMEQIPDIVIYAIKGDSINVLEYLLEEFGPLQGLGNGFRIYSSGDCTVEMLKFLCEKNIISSPDTLDYIFDIAVASERTDIVQYILASHV